MIGGGGEQLLLRTVARHADVCNFAAWRGTPEDYRRKLRVLERHCRKVGRDLAEIRCSWAAYVFLKKGRREADDALGKYLERMTAAMNRPFESLRPPIAGTPSECVEQIRRYVDVGVSLFILRFMGGDFEEEATLFAEEVAPAFS